MPCGCLVNVDRQAVLVDDTDTERTGSCCKQRWAQHTYGDSLLEAHCIFDSGAPSHVARSALSRKPAPHVHWKLPIVLMHSWEQLLLPGEAHSLMSESDRT
jgi:hypothetical protein